MKKAKKPLKTKEKTPDYSIYDNYVTKSGSFWEARDAYSEGYVTEKRIMVVANKLLDWSASPNALAMEEFWGDHQIPYFTFIKWTKRYPALDDAYQQAKMRLAARRERRASEEGLNQGIFMVTQSGYSPFFREQMEWREGIKKTDDKQLNKITVELEQIPALKE